MQVDVKVRIIMTYFLQYWQHSHVLLFMVVSLIEQWCVCFISLGIWSMGRDTACRSCSATSSSRNAPSPKLLGSIWQGHLRKSRRNHVLLCHSATAAQAERFRQRSCMQCGRGDGFDPRPKTPEMTPSCRASSVSILTDPCANNSWLNGEFTQ
jgi:hypothetical protein